MNLKKIILLIFIVIALATGSVHTVNYFNSKPHAYSKALLSPAMPDPLFKAPLQDDQNSYDQTVQNLNTGWENIRLGNRLTREGDLEGALAAYKKAYEVDPGNRLMSGDKLIEAYENLKLYDEAISMVDEIISTQPLVEYGIQRFNTIRARLLAAKNASQK